jgi:urease accessory protein
MRRAILHFKSGAWPSSQARDALTLAYDDRHRRRIRLETDAGVPVLLDLPRTVAMADGDGLRCADGSWLAVRAAPEPLVEVRCLDAADLARISWHLGNRHVPTQLVGGMLRIRPDHVIEEMLCGLGATVAPVTAPFQPEGGAYDHAHGGEGAPAHVF